jgi:hypothetical protein
MSDVKVENKGAVKENRSAKVEQVQEVLVTVDRSDEQILQFNVDRGVRLVWDVGSFRKLPEAVVDQLTVENMKAYVRAEALAEAKKPVKVEVMRNPLQNPLTGYAETREKIRERKGWHQTWANPGRDFDAKMAGPYKQVREPTEEQKRKGYQPGEENGEVLKRITADGKVEAIALECEEHLFKAYLKWMADASSQRKTGIKQDFFTSVETLNKGLHRSQRVLAEDLEGELQA